MTLDEMGRIATAWIAERDWQIAVTILLVGAYVLLDRLATPRIAEGAEHSRFNDAARVKAIRAARVIVGIFALLILTIVWGVDIGSVMIFATTRLLRYWASPYSQAGRYYRTLPLTLLLSFTPRSDAVISCACTMLTTMSKAISPRYCCSARGCLLKTAKWWFTPTTCCSRARRSSTHATA